MKYFKYTIDPKKIGNSQQMCVLQFGSKLSIFVSFWSSVICSENPWTGLYMIGTSVMKELISDGNQKSYVLKNKPAALSRSFSIHMYGLLLSQGIKWLKEFLRLRFDTNCVTQHEMHFVAQTIYLRFTFSLHLDSPVTSGYKNLKDTSVRCHFRRDVCQAHLCYPRTIL